MQQLFYERREIDELERSSTRLMLPTPSVTRGRAQSGAVHEINIAQSITVCRHIGIMGLTNGFNSSTFSLNRLPWHVSMVVTPETDTLYRKGSDRPAIVPSSACERHIWRFRHDSTSLP